MTLGPFVGCSHSAEPVRALAPVPNLDGSGGDTAQTIFNGGVAPVTIGGVTYAPGATIAPGGKALVTAEPAERNFQSRLPGLEHPRQFWLRLRVEHRLWAVDRAHGLQFGPRQRAG